MIDSICSIDTATIVLKIDTLASISFHLGNVKEFKYKMPTFGVLAIVMASGAFVLASVTSQKEGEKPSTIEKINACIYGISLPTILSMGGKEIKFNKWDLK